LKNKIWRDPVTLFSLRFALIFGLLIFPWPGWNDGYGSYFRELGQVVFGVGDGKRVVVFALIAATPIPWRRRAWSLAGGLILIHGFILFSLQAWIWNKSTELSLLRLSDFWQKVADDLSYTLINQMGPSFAVPMLIWILVTFNSHDSSSGAQEKSRGATRAPGPNRKPSLRREAAPCAR
jgi:hypothetical protein